MCFIVIFLLFLYCGLTEWFVIAAKLCLIEPFSNFAVRYVLFYLPVLHGYEKILSNILSMHFPSVDHCIHTWCCCISSCRIFFFPLTVLAHLSYCVLGGVFALLGICLSLQVTVKVCTYFWSVSPIL